MDKKKYGTSLGCFFRLKRARMGLGILLVLVLFAVFVPVFCGNAYTESTANPICLRYAGLFPKSRLFAWAGWDGCYEETLKEGEYYARLALAEETGKNPIQKVYRADYENASGLAGERYYDVRTDSYIQNGMFYLQLTEEEYRDIQDWQMQSGIQVIYPAVEEQELWTAFLKQNANIWYACREDGTPRLDEQGNFIPVYLKEQETDTYHSIRIPSDDGSFCYARIMGSSDALVYQVRVFGYTYFQYRFGETPSFLFGTNASGRDILTGLAKAARFSFLLALCVSGINFIVGVFYGAVSGYYGGRVDLIMERIADVLNGIPLIVVIALFQLHLSDKAGVFGVLLLAFITTGFVGMARVARIQFYRYKNRDYVLAARMMGAKDLHLMRRHIFPNAWGTLITYGVMLVPEVIYAETSLTYLGIVSQRGMGTDASIGSMLAAGQSYLMHTPYMVVFPALYVVILMIAFQLTGDGLRDAFLPGWKGERKAYGK